MLQKENSDQPFEYYLGRFIEDENNLSSYLRANFELMYAVHRNDYSELQKSTDAILIHHLCQSQDSVRVFSTWAEFYNKQGYYNSAIENIVKVINIHNREEDFLDSEFAHSSIASILMKQKLYKEAIDSYAKSFSLKTEYKNALYPYQIMNNMGLAYHYLNQPDSALFYFNSVLNYIENEIVDSNKTEWYDFFLGLIKGNIGDVYLSTGNYEDAEPLLLSDLEASYKANEIENACITALNLAKVYLEIGRLDDSKLYLEKALVDINRYNFRNVKRKYFLFCAEYNEKVGNHLECVQYYKAYSSLNDSIHYENENREMVNQNLDFELLRKEKELHIAKVKSEHDSILLDAKKTQLYFTMGLSILLLIMLVFIYRHYIIKAKLSAEMIVKNHEIEARGEELQKALNEKDLMLKEIHHRVKNNLQLVSSLLRLQSIDVDDEKVSNALQESINRLSSISLIHHKLYTKENFHSIALKSYYESLIEQISNFYHDPNKTIICETNISDINISIDKAIPVGLIVNEIITNSFKYAFEGKESGIIASKIEKVGKTVKIQLRDNGIGIEDFEENNSSFGMTLINLLVEQIDGKIEFYNDDGAVFEIEFKDSEDSE